jgi:hypothetical protein
VEQALGTMLPLIIKRTLGIIFKILLNGTINSRYIGNLDSGSKSQL